MDIYEKARVKGLDERQIALSQAKMTPGMPEQHVAVHEALDRVLIHAMAYDFPGESVCLHWLGIGLSVPGSKTLAIRYGDCRIERIEKA